MSAQVKEKWIVKRKIEVRSQRLLRMIEAGVPPLLIVQGIELLEEALDDANEMWGTGPAVEDKMEAANDR